MGHLTGKTAIITGGGKTVLKDGTCGSIGYGIATAYAKEGCNLVLTGRDEQKLLDAKEELERLYGIEVLTFVANIQNDRESEKIVEDVVKGAVDKFGRIDVLINNAQASEAGVPLAAHTTDQFDLAIFSGLYATFYYMRECYPHLVKTQGTVINFASSAAMAGGFGQAANGASKEGIRALTRVAATEWAADGITVNSICPLAWTLQIEKYKKAYPESFKKNWQVPPMGRFGDPELEIGRVCVQLANPDFKYMTGDTIMLEGGMSLRP